MGHHHHHHHHFRHGGGGRGGPASPFTIAIVLFVMGAIYIYSHYHHH